jgi:glycosyltransferase involved in cell wall biosynthesis
VRIVHVNDIAYVGSTLTAGLRGQGIDADLVRLIRPGAGHGLPFRLAVLPVRIAGILAAGLEVRRRRADLVHVHFARLGVLGPLSGRPYVLHCHGTDIRGVVPGSAWGREVAPFLRGASLVLYSTPDLRPWVEAFRPDAIFLPNPIDLPAADSTEPDTDLLVGVRLDPIKGVDAIVATMEAVVRRRPETTITVISQGRAVGRVAAIAPGRTRMLPPVSHADLPGLLVRHRVVVGQLGVGAIGNYELEAMAARRPVVSSFRYPEAYPVRPPLVEGDTADARADAIIGLLDDRTAREALGSAARAWVETYHATEVVVRRLLTEYRRLLGIAL